MRNTDSASRLPSINTADRRELPAAATAESSLEPSRTIAPSYETTTLALASGRIVTGVRVVETADTLTIGDDQGKSHEILKSEIDERLAQPRSTMPAGLEKRLSDREFLDLITFLLAQSTSPQ